MVTFPLTSTSDTMSDVVEFAALINREFFHVRGSREATLDRFYDDNILTNRNIMEHIPNVSYGHCTFSLLQNPVSLYRQTDEQLEKLKQSCMEEATAINPITRCVGDLAQDFSAHAVLLIIDVPLAQAPRKHPLEESSIAENIKRAKIFEYTPSSIGYPKYREMQGHDRRLFDRRRISNDTGDPILDDKIPPISLLFQPFGTFLDTYRHRSEGDPGEAALPLLKRQVDQFATEAAKIYAGESSRRDACLNLMNQIFSTVFSTVLGTLHQQITAGPIQGTEPELTADGHSTGPHGEPICIVEVKNEQADIHSIPIIQVSSYYSHFVKRLETTLSSSRLPTLGITIVGPVITFYALVCLHGRFHYTSLTPGLSCVDHAADGDDREDLYRAFTAAATLLRDIAASPKLPHPLKNSLFPVITDLPSIEPPGTRIQFRIEDSIVDTLGRYVYYAIASDGSHLVIKFTSRYSVDLHMHCARQGHAPKLRGFGRLPGNLFGVAMDLVQDAYPITSRPLADRKTWATQLQQLVESFHANGYVHGDLRYPNIPFANGKVMLLDYDWGGKENEVSYPHHPLARELTERRGHDDLKITKADDKRVLKLTLELIEIGIDEE